MVLALTSTLFERLPIGAYRSTPAGKQLRANAALVRLNGYASEAEMLAATGNLEEGWYVEPGRRAEFRRLMALDGHVTDFVSEVHRHKTRERIWVRETAHALYGADGTILCYEGTVEDITHSHQAGQALAESEARWRLALEAAGDGVWDWHVQSGHEFCTDRLAAMLGYAPGELSGDSRTLQHLTHPDDRAQKEVDMQAHLDGLTATYRNEHRVRCRDGGWKWVLSRGMVVERDAASKPLRAVGTYTDISERKMAEALIWQQAHFDALTGLPNRRMLRMRLDAAIRRSVASGRPLAVLFIDLDHFKEVNDTLGHNGGDLLLVEAARRIQASLGASNTVARMGGDEFTVLVQDLPQEEAAPQPTLVPRLEGLLRALGQPFCIGADHAFVSASVGVALYPDHGQQAEDLFRHADQALYAAKGAGRNRFHFFSPELQDAARLRARLDADLRGALAAGQLEVFYQPMVALRSGRVYKAEALLRWHHPVLGEVPPAQFIPIAEASGSIVSLGDWVFQQAALQVMRWRQVFDPEFQVSVNKSPVQCHQKVSLQTTWAAQLPGLGLTGGSMAIEITEGMLLDSSPEVLAHLDALRAQGMQVALDDFGTGYSSLNYLQKFKIDCIKIDRSFVCNLGQGSTDLALCRAVIALAHELGMYVVAEGVETADQCELLRQVGCDFGQGYLFARPMPAVDFDAWMAARHPDSGPSSQ